MNEADDGELKGLGGWLVLIGIGVVIGPIQTSAVLIESYPPLYTDGLWEALTTVGKPSYHPLWAPFIIGEVSINIAFLLVGIWLIYLFFSRHFRFPKTFIWLTGLSIVFFLADAWVATIVMPDQPMFDGETGSEFFLSAARAAIWIPYLLLSVRVKNTFVEKRRSADAAIAETFS